MKAWRPTCHWENFSFKITHASRKSSFSSTSPCSQLLSAQVKRLMRKSVTPSSTWCSRYPTSSRPLCVSQVPINLNAKLATRVLSTSMTFQQTISIEAQILTILLNTMAPLPTVAKLQLELPQVLILKDRGRSNLVKNPRMNKRERPPQIQTSAPITKLFSLKRSLLPSLVRLPRKTRTSWNWTLTKRPCSKR